MVNGTELFNKLRVNVQELRAAWCAQPDGTAQRLTYGTIHASDIAI
jgi:hypothetical protein